MFVTQSDILDLFKKEKRPLLWYEVVHKFSSDPEEEFDIIPDQEFGQKSQVPIYIWYKTGLNSYTKRKVPYFFHPEMLEEFWFNEILYILKKKNDEVVTETIIDELGKQVVNYYGLKDPLGESFDLTSDAGLGEEKNATLLKFLNKHNNNFYVRQGEDWLLGKKNLVGLVEWKDKVLDRDMKIIRNVIIKVLRDMKEKNLSLKDLTYSVNRIKLDTLIPKPFNEELIKEIVIQNSGRLVYDISKDAIALPDDLEYITNYFKENRQHFNEFIFPQDTSGLLAWIFTGSDFPMKEAIEYVKTRPIIFMDEILHRTSNSLLINDEFREYLKAVMDTSDNEEIEIWLSENVTLSYYEESLSEIKKLYPKIIEKFSPVFNVNKNPGNLFQYTLKSKYEEYCTKNPDIWPLL